MAYVVPTFPLTCRIWHNGADVQSDPPDLSPACNLVSSRPDADPKPVCPATTLALLKAQHQSLVRFRTLLLPKLTDVRGSGVSAGAFGDLIECPAGSGRFYVTTDVDDTGKGFSNEHRWAYILPMVGYVRDAFDFWGNTPDWPYPTP